VLRAGASGVRCCGRAGLATPSVHPSMAAALLHEDDERAALLNLHGSTNMATGELLSLSFHGSTSRFCILACCNLMIGHWQSSLFV
jgi:hypothetical protein